MKILVERHKELGKLMAEWYKQFGKVGPRHPYNEDEAGGEGASQLLFEEHPLLANLPIGASSDLDFIISNNARNINEAQKREDQASPELKKQLDLQLANKLTAKPKNTATPTPLPF